ncbi:CvpA family protein [Acidihalobacter prosperus]|uniref:Colicin V production protein CvpA n=1 Tax=Acidihalobacter prosperus TaxID=160660 RepID=A0A1A6C2Y3_9GAMM|nr:CvpA family protein [Acidihalobacter prosperus]OBS08914.1 colicin V production protein CvpA [Acidihalobacter prosperus]
MNGADVAIVAIILVSVIVSLFRGFVRESLSLATWVLAFWLALEFSDRLSTLLPNAIHSPLLRIWIAFGVLFIVTLVLGALFNNLAAQLIKRTGLSGTDRALGILFGVARGALLVVLLVLLAGLTALPQENWWHHSYLLEHFQRVALWLRAYLPPRLADQISYS